MSDETLLTQQPAATAGPQSAAPGTQPETSAAPAGAETKETPAQPASGDAAQATPKPAETGEAGGAVTTAPEAQGEPKAEEKPQAKAPERYEFALPATVAKDDPLVGEYSTLARELDLPQEAAQKVLDLYGKAVQAQVTAYQEQVRGWQESVKADAEIGGLHMDERLDVARRAFATLGSPKLKELFAETGIGNHPEVLRLFYRLGTRISEPEHVSGGATPTPAESDEAFHRALFPKSLDALKAMGSPS